MGVRQGGWMTIWEIVKKGERSTEARVSTSRKMPDGEYKTDFSGFVRFVGAAHVKAADLKPKDRIKLEAFEVSNDYDKEKKITYYHVTVFEFSLGDGTKAPASKDTTTETPASKATATETAAPAKATDSDDDLPF